MVRAASKRRARRATIAAVCVLVLAVPALVPSVPATSYPGAAWSAAASCNYTSSNRESSYNIDQVVIHTAQGSYAGTISWFKNCAAGGSSHYVVSKSGAVTAMVRDQDVAWHAGHWGTNTRSIGIEHEGFVTDPNAYTTAMYEASAGLVRWLADRYNIPKDRSHIIAHSEVPGCANPNGGGASCHTDPGRYWDWNRYMNLVRGGDATAPSVPSVSLDHGGGGWTTHTSPKWRFVSSDPQTGISKYQLDPSWRSAFSTTSTTYHPTLGTGSWSLKARAQNGAGMWSGWSSSVTAKVDVTQPNALSISESHVGSGWSAHTHPSVAWPAVSDAGSGVASYGVQVDGATVWTGTARSWHAELGEGTHTIRAFAKDKVGLTSALSNTVTVRIDATPPVTSVTADPSVTRDGTTFVGPDAELRIHATDGGSGVAWTQHTLDGAAASPAPAAVPTAGLADGPHTLDVWSGDVAGNTETPRRTVFAVDATPPSFDAVSPSDGAVFVGTGPFDVTADVTDAGAGVASVAFAVDGVVRAVRTAAPFTWTWQHAAEAAGPHYVTYVAVDRVGNVAAYRADVTVVPGNADGAAATLARGEAWATAPPNVATDVGGDSAEGWLRIGAWVGDQFVGVKPRAPTEVLP